MASYDATYTDRRTNATSTRRVYSRTVAGAIRAARRRGDRIAWDYSTGRVLTIVSGDLRWEERYVEVPRGAPTASPTT